MAQAQGNNMSVTVIKARTRASNVEGLSTVISDAVAAEQARAQQAEQNLNQAVQNINAVMHTDAEATQAAADLLALVQSGDAADQVAIQALLATAVKSFVQRGLTVEVGGLITLAKKPVSGVDSIDRLVLTLNGEDFDILANSVDSNDASGKTIALGGTDFDGATVKFVKYDYCLQDNPA